MRSSVVTRQQIFCRDPKDCGGELNIMTLFYCLWLHPFAGTESTVVTNSTVAFRAALQKLGALEVKWVP